MVIRKELKVLPASDEIRNGQEALRIDLLKLPLLKLSRSPWTGLEETGLKKRVRVNVHLGHLKKTSYAMLRNEVHI